MLDKLLKAAIPEPVVCLGIRLRPFSLGSRLWLHRLDSPYAIGGKTGLDDLMLAVLVCGQTYSENLDFFSGGDVTSPAALRQWRRRLLGPFWRSRKFNFIAASNLFCKYLERANAVAEFPITEADSDRVGATATPWELSTLVHCMRLGQSLETVMDQPILLTRWLVAGYAESEGALRLVKPIPEKTAEEIAKENLIFEKIRRQHGTR